MRLRFLPGRCRILRTSTHSEFLLIREGKLEFINDGVPEAVGPGMWCLRRRM